MMTWAQERALLDALAAGLQSDVEESFNRLRDLIAAGIPPETAAQTVLTEVGQLGDARVRAAVEAILSSGASVSEAARLAGLRITLSAGLYRDAAEVARNVGSVVANHLRGLQEARDLARSIYEGYNFRPPGAEPLQVVVTNRLLPRYLREALLTDPRVANEIERAFAQLQVDGLRTPALRAAYNETLAALDRVRDGAGADLLARKLRVAFEEKVRYFANRIAQTELHRFYAELRARQLLDDPDLQVVQWQLSPDHPRPDICDYFAEVDAYGLGPGHYPKAAAPVPSPHPFCRCILAPKLTMSADRARFNPDADQAFFRGMTLKEAARIAGSRAKAQRVLDGESMIDVWNERLPAEYRVVPLVSLQAGR